MKRLIGAICLLCCLPLLAHADPPMGPSVSVLGLLACMGMGILISSYTLALRWQDAAFLQKRKFLISLIISLLFACIIWPSWYHMYQNNASYSIDAPQSFIAYLFDAKHTKKSMFILGYALYCLWATIQLFRAVYKAMRSTT